MPQDEEFLRILLEIMRGISNNIAISNRSMIEFMEDMKAYRNQRESKENQDTTSKVNAIVNARFSLLWWVVDKIAPAVGIALILALLKFLKLI